MVQHEQKNKSKDALSTCDSSSEVSDEGYKSSQGNVTNSGTSPNGRSTDLSNKSCANSSETSSHEGKLFSYMYNFSRKVRSEKSRVFFVQESAHSMYGRLAPYFIAFSKMSSK